MEDNDCTNLFSEGSNGREPDLQIEGDGHLITNDSSSNSTEANTDNGENIVEEPNSNEANRYNRENINEEPKLGMEFTSIVDASKFYTKYAGRIGFNPRKNHHKKNKKNFVTRVTFCCSKQGYRKKDKRSENASYRRPITRVGCMAEMSCALQKNGSYKVVSFEAEHNHELIRTPMKHMLKINRGMSEAQKAHADDADKSGIPMKANMELMSREIGGREHLGFLDKDYRNYIHRKRKLAMGKGDAGAILEYFHKMQSENSSFFYSIQLDEDDMITNIFWADARSVSDYGLFGDVVCFDTTYRTNEYGRPFAPFVGVNHHKQTVVFGAALLYDETAESFKWLFETFLNAMSGKQPKTILTDQSAAMANAISEVFPETYHRLCVWHIYQNAAKNLSHVFHGSKEFADDFSKCMYDYEDEDEWLLAWDKMLEGYGLRENTWLKSLFELKEKWALVYGRHTFTADMKSTQRSESMNNVLKKYLNPRLDFLRFFEQYERVLADRRYEELLADFKMLHTTPVMLTNAEMLQHGVEVYTPEVFKLFQEEYMKILNYNTYKIGKDDSTSSYKVCYAGKTREHLVSFEAATQTVTCSCMKYTFVGILCAHALKVLDKKNVKRIPPQYIEKRWTRDAKTRSIMNYIGVEIRDNPKESMGKRYSHLCRNFREIASCASEHEKLSTYVHECSVELLKNLEKMKKTLHLEDAIEDHNPLNETLVGESAQVDLVAPPDDAMAKKIVGVKRKATVGRPKGRFKNSLERQRKKPKTTTTKASKSKPTLVRDSHLSSCKSQEHQITEHGVQAGLTQVRYSLERQRKKPKTTTTKAFKSKPTIVQDSHLSSCKSQEQHITEHGVQAGLTQESYNQNGDETPFSNQMEMANGRENFGSTSSIQGSCNQNGAKTPLLNQVGMTNGCENLGSTSSIQGSCNKNGAKTPFSNQVEMTNGPENSDAASSFQGSFPLTQLIQDSIVHQSGSFSYTQLLQDSIGAHHSGNLSFIQLQDSIMHRSDLLESSEGIEETGT